MASVVSGTMTATGATNQVRGLRILIIMNFTGTASVDVEIRASDGNWIKIPDTGTGITADAVYVAEFPVGVDLRLNCTAYTNDVAYSLETS